MSWFLQMQEHRRGRNPDYRPSIAELWIMQKLDEDDRPVEFRHESHYHVHR